jgi:hypothetical protein
MENNSKANAELNQKTGKEIQPALYEQSQDKTVIDDEPEKDLNSKILKITMKIKDQYPELSKYIEEMQETIPDEKSPGITLKNLKIYYDSLNSMLNKYILEHPINAK